jgi:hypothetical protein
VSGLPTAALLDEAAALRFALETLSACAAARPRTLPQLRPMLAAAWRKHARELAVELVGVARFGQPAVEGENTTAAARGAVASAAAEGAAEDPDEDELANADAAANGAGQLERGPTRRGKRGGRKHRRE